MNSEQSLATIAGQLQQLTALVGDSEQRVRRLERHNRLLLLSLLALLLAMLGGVYLVFAVPTAQAQTIAQRIDRDTHRFAQDAGQAVSRAEHLAQTDIDRERAAFSTRIERLRADLNRVDDAEQQAGMTIAVLLHDIKATLEAMPSMAHNMAIMTQDVNRMTYSVDQMNHKMGLISHDIDDTMGRMGRFVPGW